MKAMLLEKVVAVKEDVEPLRLTDVPIPVAGASEALIRVSVCGVCHTELDQIEDRTTPPRLPIIPGHEVVA